VRALDRKKKIAGRHRTRKKRTGRQREKNILYGVGESGRKLDGQEGWLNLRK